MTNKKQEAIKEINIDVLKANNRTKLTLVSIVFLAVGLVGGYFTAINVITDSQHKAIDVVKSVSKIDQ